MQSRIFSRASARASIGAVYLIAAGVLSAGLSACSSDDADVDVGNDGDTARVIGADVPGASVAVSGLDFDTTASALSDLIDSRFEPVLTIDHQANAPDDLPLRPTTVMLFANIQRTAPLIAADPRVALDLPPRVLTYEDGDGVVRAIYTNSDYLAARYALDAAEDSALEALDDDLAMLVSDATGTAPTAIDASSVTDGDGVVSRASANDFATTLARLIESIDARDPLSRVATVDFADQARAAGRSINPSTLIVFGNPNAGTPLMQAQQTTGLDLPQKMLVSAGGDGQTTIYYNDPTFIAERHGIDGQDERLAAIAGLLDDLAATAAAAPEDET